MNILFEIIHSLTPQEIRFYKILANRTHKNKERKDLKLFEEIQKNKVDYNEKNTISKLSNRNKNNFYQLKNKLTDSINKSLTLQYLTVDKELRISHAIFLSRTHKRKGNLELAFHYLKKAEKEALNIEDYELASKIYTNILKLSYDLISIDVQKYIDKKKDNQRRLQLAQDTDIALSLVMYKIKTTQNFSLNNKTILKTLNHTLESIKSNKEIATSHTFRINIFKVVSRVLLQKNEFISLEEYLKVTLDEFNRDNIFNKKSHEDKLMLITYLSNCLYKNKKYKEALNLSKDLMRTMNEYNGILKDKYMFYYYNTLVINYSQINKNKALEVISEAKNDITIKKLPTYGVFIYLNKALIEYHQKKYKLATKSVTRLILQDDFINLAKLFQLKICIAELMIRYKINQTDLIEQKINKIKRVYRSQLKSQIRDAKILSIIHKLIFCHNIYTDIKLNKEIKNLLKETSDESASNTDIINYNEWLRNIIN
tara:strand:+ start:1297 stop:2748 length:1452 start_codon:yes stop_codon:yes gene_type:complete